LVRADADQDRTDPDGWSDDPDPLRARAVGQHEVHQREDAGERDERAGAARYGVGNCMVDGHFIGTPKQLLNPGYVTLAAGEPQP